MKLIFVLFFISSVLVGLYGVIWVILGTLNALILTIIFLILSGLFGVYILRKITKNQQEIVINLWSDETEENENEDWSDKDD